MNGQDGMGKIQYSVETVLFRSYFLMKRRSP